MVDLATTSSGRMIDFQTSGSVCDAAKPYEHIDPISVYLTHETDLVISLNNVRLIDTQRVYLDLLVFSFVDFWANSKCSGGPDAGKEKPTLRICHNARQRLFLTTSLCLFKRTYSDFWDWASPHAYGSALYGGALLVLDLAVDCIGLRSLSLRIDFLNSQEPDAI
jgi:hypothetical protein